MGTEIAGGILNAGTQAMGGILGMALEKHNDKRQLKQQKKLTDIQTAAQIGLTDYSYEKQLQMWKDTNYKAQVEELKKAGLNPGLLYGMSGGGGTTTGTAGNTGVGGGQAPSGGGEIMGMALQGGMTMAQMELIKAQADNIKADTENKKGIERDLANSQLENEVLQRVITKYTGLEAKDYYEKVKAPNRLIEAATWERELESRQGIAYTIYEAWRDGRLEKMNIEQLESMVLQNAKTRAEKAEILKKMDLLEENIKGAKLDNIITELEAKLQTETGIDRNSAGWLKILGRLFVQLFNK